ncbi:DUF1992 domain-containing protein [Nocardioides sp. MAH-18]|uniref:DUF1992 domain-containing protein n=1 Tax=Nocardioides agri TaxID=2682843 RepID=A0A6L6XS10_9ACTN|nr:MULTISPECIES: DUF1992 domain-containing protein [unclassified Nocardioides]MBA2954746.1 DUF1992 domain-containing protein [Nocardioides sp. CGMCC 1.13656]MVQ49602.1 DUF1992 domain-containing protein [Nocardioides sp. MAH-18]
MTEDEHRPARRTDSSAAAAARIRQQHTWVDLQVQQAIARGEFDDLPGAGKPIEGLGAEHDPDWWLKKLVERERIAVLPPSVQLRKEDAELDARLDEYAAESQVRAHVEDFNERVIRARYLLPEGPPLVTMPRDVEATVEAWRERRAARRVPPTGPAVRERRRHWWNRRSTRGEGDT